MNTRGNEMRMFIIHTTAVLLVFTLLIIAGFTIFSLVRIDRDEENAKQNVIDQFLTFFEDTANASRDLQSNPTIQETMTNSPMMAEAARMNFMPTAAFVAAVLRSTYDAELYAFIVNGEPVVVETKEGVEVPGELPAEAPEEGYEVLNEFNGQDGTFIAVYHETAFPGIPPDQFTYFVVDRSDSIQALTDIYDNERTRMIWTVIILGWVAIGAAVLLSTLVLRHFTKRYITRPIEELIAVSHEIMDGSFEGEVQVTESSDFADLQRLLRSGQIVLTKAAEMVSGMAAEQEPKDKKKSPRLSRPA